MINIFICGITGKMGRILCEKAALDPALNLSGGLASAPNEAIDINGKKTKLNKNGGFDSSPRETINIGGKKTPVFYDANKIDVPIDVLIDFSSPSACKDIVTICKKYRCALLVATTGYDEGGLKSLLELKTQIPLMICPNTSMGVYKFRKIISFAAEILQKADVEIIDYHHSAKADCPSGTARAIAEEIKATRPQLSAAYRNGKRRENEIGMASIRCGTITGRHDVIFALDGETITLSHNAESRVIFASGALELAQWLCGKAPGLYSPADAFNRPF